MFLSVFNLPQAKTSFMSSNIFLSSRCKAILNTNSKPPTSPFSFFLVLIKKLDSASQRPINHSIKLLSIGNLGNTLWTSVDKSLTLSFLFSPFSPL